MLSDGLFASIWAGEFPTKSIIERGGKNKTENFSLDGIQAEVNYGDLSQTKWHKWPKH